MNKHLCFLIRVSTATEFT